MLLSAACRRDTEGRCCPDRTTVEAEEAERPRSVRERLEATVSGLGELDFLRQRQEVLVRAALDLQEQVEEERRREARLSSEEKLLEENILLLRKQLDCLRRRDAGLISQLQELDQQISDLRLDTEASRDLLEMDSRPSSGFYELSDGASVSLSNSSNSVFSECFCLMADADGCLPSADELAGCWECDGLVGGLCDDLSSSATVRHSLSAPHPPTLDPVSSVVSCDSQSKYHCDLVTRHGSDVYRYPSPLHAVAVQSPAFLQMLGQGGHSRDERLQKSVEVSVYRLRPDPSPPPTSVSAPVVHQSSSWPASFSFQTPPHKHLDSYIYSLLQRRALPVRTNRPRTSISTDPSKSILRQASLCVRQQSGPSLGSGIGTLRASEVKSSWAAGGASAESADSLSPLRQWPVDSKSEEQESQNVGAAPNQIVSPLTDDVYGDSASINKDIHTNSLLKKKSKQPLPPSEVSTAIKDFRELESPKVNASPKEATQPCYPPQQEQLFKLTLVVKTQSPAPKSSGKPMQTVQSENVSKSLQEIVGMASSSQLHDVARGDGAGSHMVNTKYIPTQRQNIKIRKGSSKNVKTITMTKTRTSEHTDPDRRGDKCRHMSGSKKSRPLKDGGSIHIKVFKRAAGGGGVSSSRIKCLPASIPEGQVLDRHTTSTLSSVRSGASRYPGNHHHTSSNHLHHQNEHDQVVVVAKPKHKRNDCRRLHAIMEVPYDEVFRRVRRRRRKELLSDPAANIYLPSDRQLSSPYAYVAGSDSEYSAECASLFHSTIVDTSEDERSNCTTNCFGDSESGEEEYVEESTTTSDTEESGGGGAGGGTGGMGRGWSQLGPAGSRVSGQEICTTEAKALVKIKASHNLKKKILRFRSGSLKLMTTV